MARKLTVSISIPAYNEEHNMDNILSQIFAQKQKGFIIDDIFVSSDGSTDHTVKIAREYEDRGVIVYEGKINRGQTYRQNEIIARTTSDVLVLLNADLLLGDKEVISRLISPMLKGADLSAQWAKPLPPKTFLEHILYAGFELKYFVYSRHKEGNNIYTCVGHMRALSKRFYSTVVFPTVSEGEDQFLYLKCIRDGFLYQYTEARNLFFKLPDTFNDYKDYAKRIFQTQKKFSNVFSKELVSTERSLPSRLQIRGCLFALLKHHIHALLYIIMHVVIQQWALKQPENSESAFKVAKSTKKLSTKIRPGQLKKNKSLEYQYE